jgi:hypothetical protein
MAKSAAAKRKRKRKAVRSAKKTRTNTWWYGLTALVLIAGVAVVVYARANTPSPVGPFVVNQNYPANDPHNKDTHWHAALGIYDCDHWLGDGTTTPGSSPPINTGVWLWPGTTTGANGQGSINRVDANGNITATYAGLHSHDDGIIHMEPAQANEAGNNATVGNYFNFAGWHLSSSGFSIRWAASGAPQSGQTVSVEKGSTCNGAPGGLQWAHAKWDGTNKPQKFTLGTGNPADFKLHDGDVVIIAFLPEGKSVLGLGNPPSLPNLVNATGRGESVPTSTPPATSPATAAPPTSKP